MFSKINNFPYSCGFTIYSSKVDMERLPISQIFKFLHLLFVVLYITKKQFYFKGIVSGDWGDLLLILVDR
jgi:hypothetical protein